MPRFSIFTNTYNPGIANLKLEFRTETLKKLLLCRINFQETDLSFKSKFERLERGLFRLNVMKLYLKGNST